MGRVRRLFPLLLLVAAIVPAAASALTSHARVWLSDSSPAVARGAGFHDGDPVVVTLDAPQADRRKTVDATATGAFVARFRVTLDECSGRVTLTARDAHGTTAVWVAPQRSCGNPQ
jgi:hypothetical protein